MAVIQTYEAAHLSGAATYIVLDGPGVLHSIVVGTAGTTVTVYDNTAGSGDKITTIGAVTGTFTFDVALTVGLTVVIVGAADVTVLTT
jgi:hypothetical protein